MSNTLFIALLTLCACDSTPSCVTRTCVDGGTFSICPGASNEVVFGFPSSSCTCNAGDCGRCNAAVTSFCAGNTDGGTQPGSSCVARFSGAFNGAWNGCAISVVYTPASASFTIATRGSILPGQSNTWTGFDLVEPGVPAAQSYGAATSVGAYEQISDLTISNSPLWLATATLGTLMVQLDTLGAATELGQGNLLYAQPHGGVQSTLVDTNASTAQPNELVSVTF